MASTFTTVPQPSVRLHTGQLCPLVHFGSYGGDDSPDRIAQAVDEALRCGYTAIDAAQVYTNEKEIGQVIHSHLTITGRPRSDLFVVSKLWNTNHRPEHVEPAVRQSISDLHCDYLDVLLLHWPVSWKHTGLRFERGTFRPVDENGRVQVDKVPLIETWRAMEKLVDNGLVKAIGVSNFTAILLHDLLTQCRHKPVMNQVESHPYLSQEHLLTYCKDNDIVMTAYSPLGRPARAKNTELVIQNPEVIKLAHQLSQDALTKRKAAQQSQHEHSHEEDDVYSPATILLAWNVMRGVPVLPKSATPARIAHNLHSVIDLIRHFEHFKTGFTPSFESLDVNITPESFVKTLNSLNRNLRYVNLPIAGPNAGTFMAQGSTLYE